MELQDTAIRLREQLISANMDADKGSVATLSKVIKDKDKQIEELTDQLKNAADEIESGAALVEDLRTELHKSELNPNSDLPRKYFKRLFLHQ